MTRSYRTALSALFIMAAAVAFVPGCGTNDENEFAACVLEDGSYDCSNPACDQAPQCRRECAAQVPTCEPAIRGISKIDRICAGGKCQAAGPWAEDELARGNLIVQHNFDVLSPSNLRSFATTLHHSIRPDGGTLSCADLMALEDIEDPAASNIVGRFVDSVNNLNQGQIVRIPLSNVPITERGETFLIFSRFFTVTKDERGEPRGNLAGRGCTAAVEVPEGPYMECVEEEDCSVEELKIREKQSPRLTVKPGCDAKDPNACQDGKVCVVQAGMCRYRCEPACTSSAQVCRPKVPGEQPECLRRCYPDVSSQAACPSGEICNTAPGEEPACLPVD